MWLSTTGPRTRQMVVVVVIAKHGAPLAFLEVRGAKWGTPSTRLESNRPTVVKRLWSRFIDGCLHVNEVGRNILQIVAGLDLSFGAWI